MVSCSGSKVLRLPIYPVTLSTYILVADSWNKTFGMLWNLFSSENFGMNFKQVSSCSCFNDCFMMEIILLPGKLEK